jgi:hypothetical protein
VRRISWFDIRSFTDATLTLKESRQGRWASLLALLFCLVVFVMIRNKTQSVHFWVRLATVVLAPLMVAKVFRTEQLIAERSAGILIYVKKLVSSTTVTVPIGEVDISIRRLSGRHDHF